MTIPSVVDYIVLRPPLAVLLSLSAFSIFQEILILIVIYLFFLIPPLIIKPLVFVAINPTFVPWSFLTFFPMPPFFSPNT